MDRQDENTKEYYDINCIECGDIFKANELTFNIDELLKNHASDIRRKKNNKDYDVFRSIKLGMNYKENEIKTLLEKGSIDTSDIRSFLSSRYGIYIEVEEKKEQLVEELPQIRSRRRLDFSNTSINIPDEIMDKYRDNIKFRARDVDSEMKSACYEQLHRILTKNEEILAIENFEITYKEDDRGNSILDAIKYSFSNGKQYMVDDLCCPYCGAPIKGTLGEHKQFVIGMIGSARVGKTAYLASLVDRIDQENEPIDRNIFVKIGAAGVGKEEFEKNIMKAFVNNKPIPKTPPINGWVPVFCLDIKINGVTYIFTFVDMPGEIFCSNEDDEGFAFKDQEFIMNTQRIIANSDMLWFCIDPIQVDYVIQKTQKELGNIEKSDKVVDDLNKLFSEVQKKLKFIKIADKANERKKNKENKKAAILLTKSDTIGEEYHLFEKRGVDDRLTTEVDGISKFKFDLHKKHTEKVYKYLYDKKPIIMSSFEDMFKEFNVFAVASYGIDLNNKTSLGRKPSNVEHPFLWTCVVLGILPCEPKNIVTIKEEKTGFFIKKIKEIKKEEKIEVKREELFFNKNR